MFCYPVRACCQNGSTMHTLLNASVILLMTAGAGAVSHGPEQEPPAAKTPRKGDTIVVKGCLTGQALEATDLGSVDVTGALSSGVTFRLTGDRNLLKQLRDEHDGKVVEVEGLLKSDLPKESAATRKVGKMRIVIGTPAASPISQEAETKRSLPVLEVKSFDGSTVTCGR
jgi:hypothetical protein